MSRRPAGARRRQRDLRERAYRANNRGIALLERFEYPEAAAAFREALAIDGGLAIARLNLSLALLYASGPGAAPSARRAKRRVSCRKRRSRRTSAA